MTLKQWQNNGWLKSHKTSAEEIGNLLAIVKRDLQDSGEEAISADWRFGIAYNAALKLCTVLLYAEGYRPEKTLAHYRTLQALPLILGIKKKADAEYLDACRAKRNTVEYDFVGGATEADADELVDFVKELEQEVLAWLKEQHPDLLE
jgi:hypothetical protein